MADQSSGKKLMRMRDLVAATGLPKGTIQYYINEGLISKPIKKSVNSALYTENHLNDILLVKSLQKKRFLPLSVIKEIMKGGDGQLSMNEIKTLMELQGKIFRSISEETGFKAMTAKQLSRQTGISLSDIKHAEALGIISPTKKGRVKHYGEDDVRLMECWAEVKQIGFTKELGFDLEIAVIHQNTIRKLAEEEGKVIATRLTGKFNVDEIARMIEKITPVINTMIGIMHKKEIENTTKWYALQVDEKEDLTKGKTIDGEAG